jgi:hypothetical protein
MSDIWEFRRMVERLLILFLWINGVVVGVVGFSLSADGAATLGEQVEGFVGEVRRG